MKPVIPELSWVTCHGFQVGPEDPPRQVAAVLEEVGAASFEVPRGRPDAGGRGEKDAGGAGAQRWGWGCFEMELVKGAWENTTGPILCHC